MSANVNGATCGPFVKEMISLVLVYHHKGNKDVILKKERCEYFYFKILITDFEDRDIFF